MNIDLNDKKIKEMCGTVSFKRGDSLFRANKVTIENFSLDYCEATVRGNEDFFVTIEKDFAGGIRTKCSCPKLASIKNDCQHIAAVLLTIYEQHTSEQNKGLTEGLLKLFNDRPKRASRHQLHFENRQIIDAEFTIIPVNVGNGSYMFGIEMKIGSTAVLYIRDFLEQVKKGNSAFCSTSFTYQPNLHCFSKEADAVIQQFIQVTLDEKVYFDHLSAQSDLTISNQILLIPPSSWERLVPFLIKAPIVKLFYDGKKYEDFRLSDEVLPLQFDFTETVDNGYQLVVKGLNQIIVLGAYRSVLYEGKLFKLKSEESECLSELKQMLAASGANRIQIPEMEIDDFLEKVVPGLKKLGRVQMSEAISKKYLKTPLVAKLYLDRVKNRLLAGLEFHYENFMINPLESRDPRVGAMLIRDEEKENAILQIMDDSSFVKTESGYYLHNEELEFEFLYNVIPKLQKLVQIYATTSVRNRVIRGNVKPRIRVKLQKERTNWLEFKFEMDGISDNHIRELLSALEEKRKYYRLRDGSLLSLTTSEFEEVNRFLKGLPFQYEDLESGLNLPVVRGLRLLDSDDSKIFSFEASFRQFLDNIRNPDAMDFEVPKSLAAILRDYQKHGYKWMKTIASYGFGGILADDMGLGKTLQCITYILSELLNIKEKKLPVLIVCPSSLTYNWLSEIKKFAPEIDAMIVDGNKTERIKIQKDFPNIDVAITSYPLLLRDIKWYENQSFHTVFFDEAQAFKNPVTRTAKAVKKIQADHRFAITGTPVENSLEELWSIFHVVFPELFLGLKEYSNLSRKQIARRIRPFLLRRMKEEVLLELPAKNEILESVELFPDQKKLYAAYLAKLRHETLKHLDKDTLRKNRIKVLAGLTRLRQICCHPALFVDGYNGSSAKFEQLMQILEESKLSERRVLIYSQFTKMLQIIGRELAYQGRPYFYLDGQTPSEVRLERCNRFNAGERDLFLISLKAGGTGLNLTGADTVILYDIWWNPAVEEQAADRAHRIGQKNVVQVIKLFARGTIEEKMNELQEKKRNLIEEIIDYKEKSSFTLTEEDIKEILMI